jgi:DNA-binding beta-propeller fold protein YncE
VQANGALAELSTSPFAAGVHPDGMSAVGTLVTVADGGESGVSSYVSLSTGALKPAAKHPVHVGASDLYEAFLDPTGKFLYVPDDGSQDSRVYAFSVATNGKLKKVAKSPFRTGGPLTTNGMAVGPKFLYTLGDGHPDIQIMARNTKGMLTNVATMDSGTNFPAAIALDPAGQYAAVASDQGDRLAIFSVNATTGALAQTTNMSFITTNVAQLLFVHH